MKKLNNIVFCGTSEFALPSLAKMSESGCKPALVITQPDKPKGRNRTLSPGKIKVLADRLGIEVLQPYNINSDEILDMLSKLKPKLLITVSYGGFLKKRIRALPRYGCVNLHPSLLPKYRGAAPVNYTLFNGDEITGNTIFKLTARMDAGPILYQSKLTVSEQDNYTTLSNKLADKGASDLLKVIGHIDSLKPIIQNEEEASYSKKIEKEDTVLNWKASAKDIHNKVRGLSYLPGAVTTLSGKKIKILETEPIPNSEEEYPGKIIKVVKNQGFIVATGTGALLVLTVQLQGKKIMKAFDFSLGYRNLCRETFT